MSDQLFRSRLNEDIARRSYYGKFIFNSHFLIFLTITAGFFLYSLLSLLETLEPTLWLDVIAAFLVSILLIPAYRTLLKEADGVFLLPYEAKFGKYLSAADRYSLTLGIIKPLIGGTIAVLLLTVGHGLVEIITFIAGAIIFYVMNFHIKKAVVNSRLSTPWMMAGLIGLSFISLMLIVQSPFWLLPAVAVYWVALVYARRTSHPRLDWNAMIDYEASQLNSYYRNVALFTNVSHIDKQFKRRRYLDPFLWQPKGRAFSKEKMYEYLFYRTFARSHDLPMIILRLILLFGIVMVWIGNLYFSIIIVLFGIYIIVLQMSQIYTAQAYLLWPKVWPVDRGFIQKSYVDYSHKLVLVISVLFSLIFLGIHYEYFFLVILFPLWGYFINRSLSRTVYRKEKELSD
ncbi:ABC transporter permease [Salinicoccus cyprini]|uniref:ABC transporter permease n=1 Tax=Salinicoccus cyprini TaxID=2493691 RepID=A0A558AZY7_9STAP|nr:ABC transporter permease [Salinicoccus cyprini]TVT29804.1 ABC transporter permease [Salinicoccus cyprini]